jgi:hypothetical protein
MYAQKQELYKSIMNCFVGFCNFHNGLTTEYTQSGNRCFSGVHFIMMETLAQAGEGGACTPTPFHYTYLCTITYKIAEYSPAETLTLISCYTYAFRILMDYMEQAIF